MKTIYICGPMTGLPENNYPAFHEAAQKLRAAGHNVINPAENQPPSKNPRWADWMRLSIQQVTQAHTLALLPGWSESTGALLEVKIAEAIGCRFQSIDAILNRPTKEG